MASANPVKDLQDEVTCSICLDFFQDPVMIVECGHNFCGACITKHWQGSDRSDLCPECRRLFSYQSLKPNRQLGKTAEKVKQVSAQLKSNKADTLERMCKQHQKALTLFCKTEERLICQVCEKTKAHRSHAVVYAGEAAADYKEVLLRHLADLKQERNRILSIQSNGEKPSQNLLKEVQAMKLEIVSEFHEQQQFLEQQKQLQLSKLRDLEKEIEKRRADYASKFVDEISYITDLIGDVEKKAKQPANELLQDIRYELDRYEKEEFKWPVVPHSSDVQKKLNTFSQDCMYLQRILRKFRETPLKPTWIKENVLLDRETAHPRYVVSEDWKSVRWGDIRQEFPYNPKRFQYIRGVLGCEGFTSGKHYWTVDVGNGGCWAVGVARESVEREVQIDFQPDEGIWAIAHSSDQYKALTSPPTLLDVEDEPTQIKVCLNYEKGTVAFYDVYDDTRLFKFFSVNFEEEEVFPFFRIVDSSTVLELCS
ncbi:E3 ubiquitin-protein ligase TRIM39-like [Heteronotia binoei]|uniref:E3 ubiquitin-protein ligase TRIM39-like n=1 Tax=Heteronotia binoei TaxID=13085 RepID=UPI0029316A68|nr:E3 ubiquitin-protein ligase TRIM39-like [Heteronotia binoei]